MSNSNYSLQKLNDSAWSVSYKGPVIAIFPPPITDGTDQLTNIERLQFTDKNVALDLNGNAGTTAKILFLVEIIKCSFRDLIWLLNIKLDIFGVIPFRVKC